MRSIIFLMFLGVGFVHAHSGRTNADGCHAGSQPYHCHGSKKPVSSYEASSVGTIEKLTVHGQILMATANPPAMKY